MRIFRCGVMVSLLTLYAPSARAQGAGNEIDRIELDDGTEARGKITEIEPGDHITMRRSDGSMMTWAWSHVRRIERGLPAPAPAPEPAPAPAPAPARNGERVVPAVLLHVDSSRVVEIQHRPSEEYEWARACASPCDTKVPLGDQYRVAGDGVRPSSSFLLRANAGDRVRLSVSSSSTTANGFGKAFLIGGGVVVVLGLASSDSSRGVVVGLGVVAVAVGGVLVLANLDTTYKQSVADAREPPRPTWRADANAPSSPALVLPIFRGTF